MAQVEEYQRRVQNRPEAQQDIAVQTNANTFGAGIGRGVENVGLGMAQMADAQAYRQTLEADASARETFNRLRTDTSGLLNAPETGYLNRTGSNAMGASRTAMDQVDQMREEYARNLSPQARREYDKLASNLRVQTAERLMVHEAGQSRNYIENQHTATIAGYVEEAAQNWGNPALFDENLGLALAEQARLAALQGWDAETAKNAGDALVSQAFRSRITQTALVDPIAAEQLLNEAREVLSAEDAYALDNGMKTLVLEAKANQFVQGFVRTGPPPRPGAVRSGSSETMRADAIDRPDDNVEVTFSMLPKRPNRPNQEVIDVVAGAAEAAFGAGTRVVVTSGAEDHGHQHGSERHMTGMSADVAIYRPDGSRVRATDPDMLIMAEEAAKRGALGIGYGDGYMGGDHAHFDLVMPAGSKGEDHVWGKQAAAARGQLVALMDTGADRLLQNQGRETSAVNRKLVTTLGEDHATAFLDAVAGDPAAPASNVLPPEVLAANPGFAGKSVGDVYDSMAAAMGDDMGSRAGGRNFDTVEAYAAAMAIEDPELRAQVVKQIDAMSVLQERGRAAEREDAQRQLWDEYTATGRTDFPLEMRQRVGQAGWTAFTAAARADQIGVNVTDPDTWDELTRTAVDQEAFAYLNLETYKPNLSREDRRHFVALQAETRALLEAQENAPPQQPKPIDFGRAYRDARPVYEALVEGVPEQATTEAERAKRRRVVLFEQQLTVMVREFVAAENREPDMEEVRKMATTLAMPILYSAPAGLFGGGFDRVNQNVEGALFDAAMRAPGTAYSIEVKYQDIPYADRAQIEAELMGATGQIPTPEQVADVYERKMMVSVGLPPLVGIEDVPPELIAAEKSVNPNVTDDELVRRYQLFLMQ